MHGATPSKCYKCLIITSWNTQYSSEGYDTSSTRMGVAPNIVKQSLKVVCCHTHLVSKDQIRPRGDATAHHSSIRLKCHGGVTAGCVSYRLKYNGCHRFEWEADELIMRCPFEAYDSYTDVMILLGLYIHLPIYLSMYISTYPPTLRPIKHIRPVGAGRNRGGVGMSYIYIYIYTYIYIYVYIYMSMYVHSRIITEKVLPPRFAFDADLAMHICIYTYTCIYIYTWGRGGDR